MTIDEAIRVLERDRFDNPDYYLEDFQDAIDLGIEALKLEITRRQKSPSFYTERLPGETEE